MLYQVTAWEHRVQSGPDSGYASPVPSRSSSPVDECLPHHAITIYLRLFIRRAGIDHPVLGDPPARDCARSQVFLSPPFYRPPPRPKVFLSWPSKRGRISRKRGSNSTSLSGRRERRLFAVTARWRPSGGISQTLTIQSCQM